MASLSALAWEAHRRGLTYGELAARLKPGEDVKIQHAYRKWKETQEPAEWGGREKTGEI